MPGRTFNGGDYRYGFNGKEMDNEIKSIDGSSYDFGARMYDPRVGRFLSRDPKERSYPDQSPYNAFNDNPILYADPTGKSGEATIDKQAHTITITSHIIMYGGAASPELATSTAQSIQDQWNAACGTVMVGGETYDVVFEVTGEYRENLAMSDVLNNKDIKNNYIRVEEETNLITKGSYMDGSKPKTGANSGFWKLAEIEGENSTTEAHEYGHGVGQEHEDFGVPDTENPNRRDYRGNGSPPMGLPRSSLVDPEYQRNPTAAPRVDGGTLKSSTRTVKQEDIDALGLDKLDFSKNGKADVGTKTNKYHKVRAN